MIDICASCKIACRFSLSWKLTRYASAVADPNRAFAMANLRMFTGGLAWLK